MYKGVIKSIERPKGFGFIETEDGQTVFFHQRWLKRIKFRDLSEGDEVVFAINQGPRGPRAFNIGLPSAGDDFKRRRPIEQLFKD